VRGTVSRLVAVVGRHWAVTTLLAVGAVLRVPVAGALALTRRGPEPSTVDGAERVIVPTPQRRTAAVEAAR
jgi:hypothetical protein